MATYRLPILGHATLPDPSGPVYPEPWTIAASNDVWAPLIYVFPAGSTRDGLYGLFQVPQNYNDGANVVIIWTAANSANDVEWDFDYRAVGGDDSESLDQAGTQESVNSNDDAPSADWERQVLTIALTDGNFAAGDTVEFGLFRDQTDAGDTIATSVYLFELFFEYTDD